MIPSSHFHPPSCNPCLYPHCLVPNSVHLARVRLPNSTSFDPFQGETRNSANKGSALCDSIADSVVRASHMAHAYIAFFQNSCVIHSPPPYLRTLMQLLPRQLPQPVMWYRPHLPRLPLPLPRVHEPKDSLTTRTCHHRRLRIARNDLVIPTTLPPPPPPLISIVSMTFPQALHVSTRWLANM